MQTVLHSSFVPFSSLIGIADRSTHGEEAVSILSGVHASSMMVVVVVVREIPNKRTKQQTNRVDRQNGLFALVVEVEVAVPQVAVGSNPLVYIHEINK